MPGQSKNMVITLYVRLSPSASGVSNLRFSFLRQGHPCPLDTYTVYLNLYVEHSSVFSMIRALVLSRFLALRKNSQSNKHTDYCQYQMLVSCHTSACRYWVKLWTETCHLSLQGFVSLFYREFSLICREFLVKQVKQSCQTRNVCSLSYRR